MLCTLELICTLYAEDYINGKEVITPNSEPLKTMFEKFKKFWDSKKIKVVETEKTYYSKELRCVWNS